MPVTVTIDTPGDNADVPGGGIFQTNGYVTPLNATMSAWIRYADGSTVQGTPIVPPAAGYDWTFQFTGVQTDVWVTLIVEGVDPQTGEKGVDSHTIRCVAGGSLAPHVVEAPVAEPAIPLADAFTAVSADMPVTEPVAGPTAEPPAPLVTVEPGLAATGEIPEAATTEAAPPRKRPRPASRKKAAAPVKKASKGVTGKAARPAARKPPAAAAKKPGRKAAKAGAKKQAKTTARRGTKTTAKKAGKAKTGKTAPATARRGTKPGPKKSLKATAKTNPRKRTSR